MTPTHFLYLLYPPRSTFLADMTADEQGIMGRHQQWLAGHLERGKLLLAGPSLDGAFGVGLLAVNSADEAKALVADDPAVVEGLLRPSLHPIFAGFLAPQLQRGA